MPKSTSPPVPWTELAIIAERDGYSLYQLAAVSGYTAAHLSACVNGKRSPSAETIHKLATVLRVPFSMLKPHGPHDLDPVEFRDQVDALERQPMAREDAARLLETNPRRSQRAELKGRAA